MRRAAVAAALCLALIVSAQAERASGGAAILVYHRFGPTAASTTVSDAALDEQLAWLASHVRVASLRGARSLARGRNIRRTSVRRHHSGRRTSFSLYGPVSTHSAAQAAGDAAHLSVGDLQCLLCADLARIDRDGWLRPGRRAVAYVLASEFHQEKAKRSPEDYRSFVDMQLSRSRQVLETHIGRKVDMLAWPFAIRDEELEPAAARAGYVAAFILGNRAARPDSNMLALPRFWISDNDRPRRLAAIDLSQAMSTGCN